MDRLKFAEMLGNKMENLIESAKQFAMDRHKGQVRKYTGDPYFNHLQEVADIVSEYTDDEEMIAAAYLHDVLEDTETGGDELLHMFPISVYAIVWLLTDQSKPEDGNRAARKKIDRDHVLSGGRRVQIIKCADIISNTASITKHDPGFARVYLEEGQFLLEGMRDDVKSHPIWQRARNLT